MNAALWHGALAGTLGAMLSTSQVGAWESRAASHEEEWESPWELPTGPGTGRLGIEVQSLTPELLGYFGVESRAGVLVARVEPDSPAARGGIEVGDVLVAAGGEQLERPLDLVRRVGRVPAGEKLEIELVRRGKLRKIEVEPRGEPRHRFEGARAFEGFGRGAIQELRQQMQDLERRLHELEQRLEREAPAQRSDLTPPRRRPSGRAVLVELPAG